MIDITKNTTPHGLLREIDPEAAAALEAWPHGWEYWSNPAREWRIAPDDCSFVSIAVYRAIPAPVRVVRWHNMHACGAIGYGYKSRKLADERAYSDCIAVLRIERDGDGSNVTVTVEAV